MRNFVPRAAPLNEYGRQGPPRNNFGLLRSPLPSRAKSTEANKNRPRPARIGCRPWTRTHPASARPRPAKTDMGEGNSRITRSSPPYGVPSSSGRRSQSNPGESHSARRSDQSCPPGCIDFVVAGATVPLWSKSRLRLRPMGIARPQLPGILASRPRSDLKSGLQLSECSPVR